MEEHTKKVIESLEGSTITEILNTDEYTIIKLNNNTMLKVKIMLIT